MQVHNVTQTPEGLFSFDGELSASEHDLVVTMGLNFLYAQGVLSSVVPNITVTELDSSTVQQ